MDREQIARNAHKSGYNCAQAVYSAFQGIVSGSAPAPTLSRTIRITRFIMKCTPFLIYSNYTQFI